MESKVLAILQRYNQDLDLDKVNKALQIDNEPDDRHVAGVLDLILSFYPEQDTIFAVLLKDAYFNEKVDDAAVKANFGDDVLNILSGLKRLKNASFVENDKAFQLEKLKGMFLAMAKDMRVIVLELADRLYTMKHLEEMPEKGAQYLFAKETLGLYVPIADRLGIYSIKTELEDLAFSYVNPAEFENISNQLRDLSERCNVSIGKVKVQLDEFFKERGVEAEVSGRIKSVYSIYKKLKKKNLTLVSDLYDIFAMRVVLPGDENLDGLYGALGLIHSEWKPISKRFKDYIAVPKTNGYRSLHTVVLGLAPKDMDQPIEIQIRDEMMHKDAEYGVAAHWLYKDAYRSFIGEQNIRSKVDWLKAIEKIQTDVENHDDLMKEAETDAFSDRIFVLTPRGEVKDLPVGACCVDFAYAVHTDVGHKCLMAKVDGKVVPLGYELKNGEMVEILTRNDVTPKLQWLSMVKTSFARSRIKAWFSALNRENNVKEGRRLLNNQLQRIGKPLLDQNYTILKDYLGSNLSLEKRVSLVEEVGKGGKIAHDIVRKIYPYERDLIEEVTSSEAIMEREAAGLAHGKELESQILVGGEKDLPIKLAACCTPSFGDNIIGYVPRGNHVTVHKSTCPMVDNLDVERLVFTQWKGVLNQQKKYRVLIKVLVISRIGLMRDMVTLISELGINIMDVQILEVKGGLKEDRFLLEMENPDHFDLLADNLEAVKGVLKVTKGDMVKSGV